MAGEKKGKTYEALFYLALRHLKMRGLIRENIYWNIAPTGISIEPDFTIGSDFNTPSCLFLLTHSGATGNSHMKFWRNVAEVVEAKTRLPQSVRVYSVAFDSNIKVNLRLIQDVIFDAQLFVEDQPYGKHLKHLCETNALMLPKQSAEKIAMLDSLDDKNLNVYIKLLSDDVAELLKRKNVKLDQLWKLHRKQPRGIAPRARNTHARRGIGKMMLFNPPYSTLFSESGVLMRKIPQRDLDTFSAIGLIVKTISNYVISDDELGWVVRNFKPAEIQAICDRQPRERMRIWIDQVMNIGTLQGTLAWLENFWDEVICTDTLHKALIEVPEKGEAPTRPSGPSLFQSIIEWIKLDSGTRTGYGIEKLLRDLDDLINDENHRGTVERLAGGDLKWRSVDTIRLGLQDWYNPASSQKFQLYREDLARVADVLARRLKTIKAICASRDLKVIRDAILQSILETKLLTYWHLQPVESIIEIACSNRGIRAVKEKFAPACFAQLLIQSGIKLDRRAGSTSVYYAGKTCIGWQSAHDSHTGDKRKELSGRAVALRYSWDQNHAQFIPRPGIEKLILVVDGTWRREDLVVLAGAGWDEIFYPDEMDKLAKAIV
jgi:hypothetical protein